MLNEQKTSINQKLNYRGYPITEMIFILRGAGYAIYSCNIGIGSRFIIVRVHII